MHPTLKVWLDGAEDAVTVKPITVDFIEYSNLLGKKAEPNGFELRLCIAYFHLESPEVDNLKTVHAWGRRRAVIVQELDDAPDPTQPGPLPG